MAQDIAELVVLPKATPAVDAATAEISIQWTPTLEEQIRKILGDHRAAARRQNVGTPELLCLARREEKRLENDTLRKLLLALKRHQTPALDSDVLAAVSSLEDRLHDSTNPA